MFYLSTIRFNLSYILEYYCSYSSLEILVSNILTIFWVNISHDYPN